jgi:hypothetical protein
MGTTTQVDAAANQLDSVVEDVLTTNNEEDKRSEEHIRSEEAMPTMNKDVNLAAPPTIADVDSMTQNDIPPVVPRQKKTRVEHQPSPSETSVKKRFRPKAFEDFVMAIEAENNDEPK